MKRFIVLFLLAASNIFAVDFEDAKYGIGLGLGSGGYEAKGIYKINRYFSTSIEYNSLNLENIKVDDIGGEGEDVTASGTLDISAIKTLIHFHPFANGFRISGGVTFNLSDISVDIDGNIKLDGTTDTAIKGSIIIDTGSTLPYIGIGFGYSYDDFITLDFAVGVQFLPKIKGEDLLKSDVTMDSTALKNYVDTVVQDKTANDINDVYADYPEIKAAIDSGDPFDLFNAIEDTGILSDYGISINDFGTVPNPNDYVGEVQDQIDELVEDSGLGVVQDILGYAPLPVFSFGFTIFF